MMSTREPLEWHFKQLDHAVGLSFKSNFHFALVGHLLKVSVKEFQLKCFLMQFFIPIQEIFDQKITDPMLIKNYRLFA